MTFRLCRQSFSRVLAGLRDSCAIKRFGRRMDQVKLGVNHGEEPTRLVRPDWARIRCYTPRYFLRVASDSKANASKSHSRSWRWARCPLISDQIQFSDDPIPGDVRNNTSPYHHYGAVNRRTRFAVRGKGREVSKREGRVKQTTLPDGEVRQCSGLDD